jgi:hypothetical protein
MIMLGSKPGEGPSSPAGMPQSRTDLSAVASAKAEQPEPKSDIPDIQIDDSDIPF